MARILIVESNDPVRCMLGSLLQARGHVVSHAADAVRALACCELQQFDLVVMDVYVPPLDGLEICRQLRQGSQIPILIFSASREPSIEQRALACGASAFTLKPMNFDRLLSRISALLANGCGKAGGAPLQALPRLA